MQPLSYLEGAFFMVKTGSITFGMGNLNCNDCCWLLVAGNMQTCLLKKQEWKPL